MSDDDSKDDSFIIVKTIKTKWDELSSDSDDNSDDDQVKTNSTSANNNKNQSEIDYLLNTVQSNPSYTQPLKKNEFVVPVIEAKPTLSLESFRNQQASTRLPVSRDSRSHVQLMSDDIEKQTFADNNSRKPNGKRQPIPSKPNATTKVNSSTIGTKETAKDRVKRQRLTGQSGIGSDFREWRSEEEMRIRQHFD